MVVGLAWGPLSAAVGGVAATVVIASLFGLPYSLALVVANALPALWLAHLVLLARRKTTAALPAPTRRLEWYPIGRVLIWIVIFAAIITATTLLTMGTDGPAIQNTSERVGLSSGSTGLSLNDSTIDALVAITPLGD